jgi:hypothetical protein
MEPVPIPDLNEILDAIKVAQGALTEALPNIEDPELKHMVTLLSQDLESQRAELVEVYPHVMRELDEEEARLDAAAERLQKESAEWQSTFAAMDAEAAAAPPAPPEPTPLKEPTKPVVRPVHTPSTDDGSVWRDDASWESTTQGSETPATPPRPPASRPAGWDPNESVREIDESRDDNDAG